MGFRVPDQLISLNVKHGVEARNYEDVSNAPFESPTLCSCPSVLCVMGKVGHQQSQPKDRIDNIHPTRHVSPALLKPEGQNSKGFLYKQPPVPQPRGIHISAWGEGSLYEQTLCPVQKWLCLSTEQEIPV